MYDDLDVSPATSKQFIESLDSFAQLAKYMETVPTAFSMVVVQEKGEPIILLCTRERFALPPGIGTMKIHHEQDVMIFTSAANETLYDERPNAGFEISSSKNERKTVNDKKRSSGNIRILHWSYCLLTSPSN